MQRFVPFLFLLLSLRCELSAQTAIEFKLETYVSGFSEPVDIAHAGDARLFIVEKKGVIRIIPENGQILAVPFLDIDSRVIASRGEQGLLGLVFHPNYSQNGFFYVNYINNEGDTQISRFRVSTNNANVADPNSEFKILTIEQPYANHNGGDLAFGKDGYLYIGMGDGGSGGDPQNYAQNRRSLLGKMLRINVDSVSTGRNYAIPRDNPFVNDTTTRPEIWALGLRNPWRYSFDRLTGDLWMGDVGQGKWEEISRQPAASKGGENYGWRCYEGDANFNTNGCAAKNTYTFPVYDYTNDGTNTGCSVTGGYVYRGSRYPNLQGHYIYADYCSGRFWSLRPNGSGGWINVNLLDFNNYDVASFGEDRNGELYVAGLSSGRIYRVVGGTTDAEDAQLKVGKMTLSPNPAGEWVRLSLEVLTADSYQFRLLDATGRALREWRESIGTGGFVKDISLKNLPRGMYFLQVQQEGQTVVQAVQKM
jgi:glucose/arabinose dehydrogenase